MSSEKSSVIVASTAEVRAMMREELRAVVREELRAREADARAREWIDAKAAAELLGVTPRTIAKMVERGDLPDRRAGNRLRFRREELIALLDGRAA